MAAPQQSAPSAMGFCDLDLRSARKRAQTMSSQLL
jgi:hypothetical protein